MSEKVDHNSQFPVSNVNTPKKISERIEFVREALFHEIDLVTKDEALSERIQQQIAPILMQLETLNFQLGAMMAPSFPTERQKEK